MLPARKTDPPVGGAISGGWRTENPGCVSCVTGSITVGAVTGDSVVVSVGLTMVGVESAESSAGVEGVGAVAVGSAEVLVEFIVVNWKRGDRLAQIRGGSLAC